MQGSLAVVVVIVFRVLSASPLHPRNSRHTLVKWTRSLGLREPSGPGAVAVFFLGSQRARRCQVGPALGHGDLVASVIQCLLWLRDRVAATAASAGQGSACGRLSLSGPVRVAGYQGAAVVVGGWGVRERCRALCTNGTVGVGSGHPHPAEDVGCSGGYLSISAMALIAIPGCRLRLGPLFQITLPGSGGASARPPAERPECQAGESPLLFLCSVYPHLYLTGFEQGRLSLSFKTA